MDQNMFNEIYMDYIGHLQKSDTASEVSTPTVSDRPYSQQSSLNPSSVDDGDRNDGDQDKESDTGSMGFGKKPITIQPD